MIRWTCPHCKEANEAHWPDLRKMLKATCIKCAGVMCFLACTEEDFFRYRMTTEKKA